jgi:ribosomal protein S18 acetylase RimI-like enzyme
MARGRWLGFIANMSSSDDVEIHRVTPGEVDGLVPSLARLLQACVEDGASVSFVLPLTNAAAEDFWRTKVAPAVRRDVRVLLVARSGGADVGSVQLDLDTPPNQTHRGEVSKLLVHPSIRRRGIAQRLMVRLEAEARSCGRTLITLDTRTGDKAEPLYASLGYVVAGVIPGYARDPREDRLDATTYMYKRLL